MAKRLGQGVVLSNVESVDNSDELAAEFSVESGSFHSRLQTLLIVLLLKIVILFGLLLADMSEMMTTTICARIFE